MKKVIYTAALILVLNLTQSFAVQGTGNAARSSAQRDLTDIWVMSMENDANPAQWAVENNAVFIGPVGSLPGCFKFKIHGTDKSAAAENASRRLRSDRRVKQHWHQIARWRFLRNEDAAPNFRDPLFSEQWHLVNTGQNRGTSGADINVYPAWYSGFTGAGVVIGIADDGLQYTHPDLELNYRADLSYDFNDGDNDPFPGRYDTHGTPIAGLAAARDNLTCGVGVAFRAGLAGIRLIAKTCTDSDEAEGLSFQRDKIHIYSSSWGPPDYGSTLEGPGPLTLKALEDNVVRGRNGLGNIYIWAAGNGRERKDNINYDGYANSRFTIAVGSVDQNGVLTKYSECGAPLITVTPSKRDSYTASGIVTTDLLGAQGESSEDCLRSFGGTSASAPILAGVVALMLEANPNLSWRDVQHILVRTAFQNDADDPGWTTNGYGRAVSHKYGFGRVNASEAVSAAQTWISVPEVVSVFPGLRKVSEPIPDNNPTGVRSVITVSEKIRLEHAEVVLYAPHSRRGDLTVILTSPSGTESILAEIHDDYNRNYDGWTFMTARNWDEPSSGEWTLHIADGRASYTGNFQSWELKLYGAPYSENLGDAILILKTMTESQHPHGMPVEDISKDGKIGLEETIRILQNITHIRN